MKTVFYQITCLTELHMGSGENNFHIIDKTVERDPVTQYPMMNASGVKGALREYFERAKDPNTKHLFGAPSGIEVKTEDGKTIRTKNSKPGALRIFAAKLLGRPVRASSGNAAYYITTTLTALKEYSSLVFRLTGARPLAIPELSEDKNYFAVPTDQTESIGVDGILVDNALPECIAEQLMTLFFAEKSDRTGVAILTDGCFRRIALPVSARNYLVDGISDNLWYEENVPSRSSFWFAVQGEEEDLNSFENGLRAHIVQFGGDASVGKGLCLLKKVEVKNAE